jgi:hypothetical protein
MWGNWNLVCCWWKCKIVQPLWKKFWHFFKNLNRTTIWPRNCTYECISKELKTGTRRDICTPMFHSHIAHNGQKCPWRCWGCGLVVKCLPSVHTLGLIPSTAKKKKKKKSLDRWMDVKECARYIQWDITQPLKRNICYTVTGEILCDSNYMLYLK